MRLYYDVGLSRCCCCRREAIRLSRAQLCHLYYMCISCCSAWFPLLTIKFCLRADIERKMFQLLHWLFYILTWILLRRLFGRKWRFESFTGGQLLVILLSKTLRVLKGETNPLRPKTFLFFYFYIMTYVRSSSSSSRVLNTVFMYQDKAKTDRYGPRAGLLYTVQCIQDTQWCFWGTMWINCAVCSV